MFIEDFGIRISRLEELLQKISITLLSDHLLERLPPKEIWKRSETDTTALKKESEELKDVMLLLKPEKAVTIKSHFHKILQLLESFEKVLLQDKVLADTMLAFEHLRKAIIESTVFLELANEIKKLPSGSMAEIIKLKEVHDAKKYLSDVTVPETVYARFENLKRSMENLKARSISLEKDLEEMRKNIDAIREEISKFQHTSGASSTVKPSSASEPALVSKDKHE